MNYYEVTVSVFADKTLLVAAEDEQGARRRALEAIESGEVDMTDAEVEHDVVDVTPADDRLYELHEYYGGCDDNEGDYDDDDVVDGECVCDDCRMAGKYYHETKIMQLSKAVLEDMDALMEELSKDRAEN